MFQLEPGYIIWESITVLIFLIVLGKFAGPKILIGLHDRSKTIRRSLEQSESAQRFSEEVLRSAQHTAATVEDQKQRIIQQGHALAEHLKTTAIEAAQRNTERIYEDMQEEIERYKTMAIQQLRAEAAGMVVACASTIIERSLDDERHQRMVDSAIKSIPTF